MRPQRGNWRNLTYLRARVPVLSGGIVLFALCLAQFACAPLRLERVIPEGLGGVEIIRQGEFLTIEPKMNLKVEDEVKTDSTSIAVLKLGKTEVFLKPNSHIKLINPTHKIFVFIGEVFARVKDAFRVETVHVAAGTMGTEFLVTARENDAVSVVVLCGAVKLESMTQAWRPVILRKSQGGTVFGQEPPETRKVDRKEYNGIIQWVNRVEKIYRQDEAKLFVPNVVGLPKEEARRVLSEQQIGVAKMIGRITQHQPIGTILEQCPPAGTRISPRSRLTLEFEAEPAEVPRLVGMHKDRAQEMLRNSRLSLGRVDKQITGNYPKDIVIRQNPQAGTVVPVGSKVDLWVEEESVLVPDFTGLHIDQARQMLSGKQLRVGNVREEITGGAPVRTVRGQYPAPGTRVRLNSSVELIIEGESVLVPNVVGQHINQARNVLQNQRLLVGNVREEITGGAPVKTVRRQHPAPGTRVRLNSSVELIIEGESVLVPNLVGQHINQARNLLQNQGLRVGQVREELTGHYGAGTVLRQSMSSGSRVRPYTVVELVIEAEGIRVPDVTRMHQNSAVSRLRSARLQVGTMSRVESRQYPEGTVIQQYPSPGTLVRVNSPVRLVIAKQRQCIVPNVVGLYENQAMERLRNAGYVGYVTIRAGYDSNRVYRQNPLKDTRLPCGSRVDLALGIVR
jgi:beta-lactam-binding protein with PASTA domain